MINNGNNDFGKGKNYEIPVRGDIYFADLGQTVCSEQSGVRPVIIVQNNVGNKYSPTVIVAPLTSRMDKKQLPTHMEITPEETGVPHTSIALFEQIKTIDKIRLKNRIGFIKNQDIIDNALRISFGMVQ